MPFLSLEAVSWCAAGTLSALAVPLDQAGERGKLLLDETTRRLVLESAPVCSSKRDAHLPTNTSGLIKVWASRNGSIAAGRTAPAHREAAPARPTWMLLPACRTNWTTPNRPWRSARPSTAPRAS
jgi:hypothetical protein